MRDEDLIPLSALQHYLYCPRQCALIHVERIWTESIHTAEGRLLHQRSDNPGVEQRHGVRTATAMPLKHETLRSEEHTSELQSLMRISYAVFCLKKTKLRTTK